MKLGRTHQIRVHLSSINHPIVGDSLYGSKSLLIKRQALHSNKISFIHPTNKTLVTYNADVPEDMKNAFPLFFTAFPSI